MKNRIAAFYRRVILDMLSEQAVPNYVASMLHDVRRDYINKKIKLYKRLNIVFLIILALGALLLLLYDMYIPLLAYAAAVIVTVSQIEQGCIGVCAVSIVICVIYGGTNLLFPLMFAAMSVTSLFAAANTYKLNVTEKVDTTVPLFRKSVTGAEKVWDERTQTFGGDKLSTGREPASDEREKTMLRENITPPNAEQNGIKENAYSAAKKTLTEFGDAVNSATDRIFEEDDDDLVRLKNLRIILYGVLALGAFPRMFWGQTIEDPLAGLYILTLLLTLFKKVGFHVPFALVCVAIAIADGKNPAQIVIYSVLTVLAVLLTVVNNQIIEGNRAVPTPMRTVYSQGEKTANLVTEGDRQRFMNPVDEREMVMHRKVTVASEETAFGKKRSAAEQLRGERIESMGSELQPLINDNPVLPVFDIPAEKPTEQLFDIPAVPEEMPEISLGAPVADISADFEQQLIANAEQNRGSVNNVELDSEEMGGIDINQALAENNVDLTNIPSDNTNAPVDDSISSVDLQTAFVDNKIDITNSPLAKRVGEERRVSELDYKMDADSERNVMFSQRLFTNVRIESDAQPLDGTAHKAYMPESADEISPAAPSYTAKNNTPISENPFNSATPAYKPITPLMPTFGVNSAPTYAPITPLMQADDGKSNESEGIDTSKILFGKRE